VRVDRPPFLTPLGQVHSVFPSHHSSCCPESRLGHPQSSPILFLYSAKAVAR
jgi:hypothetical protein